MCLREINPTLRIIQDVTLSCACASLFQKGNLQKSGCYDGVKFGLRVVPQHEKLRDTKVCVKAL